MKNYIRTILYSCFLLVFLSNCRKEELTDTGLNPVNPNEAESFRLKSATTTIKFSGYDWYVKEGSALGPGPNEWSASNVWVDSEGKLHLRISFNPTTQKWECADVWTTTNLGFGKYEWFIDGNIDQLDKNVVLGLFNYPSGLRYPDGSNEIDIEFAKWGNESANIGNFVVWPARLISGYSKWSVSFPVSLTGTYTTHRFNWTSGSITFQSLHGWRLDDNNLIYTKTFTPSPKKAKSYIPQQALPVHINLWLFRGAAPSNNLPVEIIIGRFTKS